MSLNKAQKKAVSCKEGPCLVLAGPGSGKTLTIAKRVEYLIKVYKVRPEEILVITFTKYAAAEMKERFGRVMGDPGVPVTFGTFHGVYYGILKWAYGYGQADILTGEEKYGLIKELITEEKWETIPEETEHSDMLRELSEEIGNIKNNRQNIDAYESDRYGTFRFRSLYKAYEERKRTLRKIDFEDMLLLCYELFEERPDILKKWQQKFRYILIDEFQDINQAQYDVIRLLAAPENNIFAVGDDDQSIYGFRGARPGIMRDFMRDYPDAKKILLDVNYRSTAHIVSGALRVIGHNRIRYDKEIKASKGPEETVHVQEVRDALEESRYVAEKCLEYVSQGMPAEQIAVLYRTAADARTLSETFMEYQIPFCMKEHVEHIYEHFICQDITSYFRLALGDYERRDMLRVANRPNRYLGRDSMAEREISCESLRRFYCDKEWMLRRIDDFEWDMKMLEGKTPYAAMQYIRKSVGYDGFLREYASVRHLDAEELLSVMEELQERAKSVRTMKEWLVHIEKCKEMLKQSEKRGRSREKAVNFLTMHGAKGLEYEIVFMIQGNEGTVPYKKAATQEQIEEERRLFYVAMTRAKKKLIISYVKEKNGKSKIPSRFINELLVSV